MRIVSTAALGLALVIGIGAPLAVADDAARVSVTLKDHKFSPAEPTAPAGKPIIIDVSNLDSTPSEFESKTLRVEKVVPGGGKIAVQIRPLGAGPLSFLRRLSRGHDRGFPDRQISVRRSAKYG